MYLLLINNLVIATTVDVMNSLNHPFYLDLVLFLIIINLFIIYFMF